MKITSLGLALVLVLSTAAHAQQPSADRLALKVKVDDLRASGRTRLIAGNLTLALGAMATLGGGLGWGLNGLCGLGSYGSCESDSVRNGITTGMVFFGVGLAAIVAGI